MSSKISLIFQSQKPTRIYDANSKRWVPIPKTASTQAETKEKTPAGYIKRPESMSPIGFGTAIILDAAGNYPGAYGRATSQATAPYRSGLHQYESTGTNPFITKSQDTATQTVSAQSTPLSTAGNSTQSGQANSVSQATQSKPFYFMDWLKANRPDLASYQSRKAIASKYGINGYEGNPEQNIRLWDALKAESQNTPAESTTQRQPVDTTSSTQTLPGRGGTADLSASFYNTVNSRLASQTPRFRTNYFNLFQ